jgi:hypothetical protein
MKFLLLVSLVSIIVGCQVYEQPTLLSLSGEYIINKITYNGIDNTTSKNDSIYLPGSIYIDTLETFPLDTIELGITKWHFDYTTISMKPTQMQQGRVIWEKKYYYNVINHYSNYDLGYIDFNCDGRRRVFKILDDGITSLTLNTMGRWGYSTVGSNVSLTLYLTRIGP